MNISATLTKPLTTRCRRSQGQRRPPNNAPAVKNSAKASAAIPPTGSALCHISNTMITERTGAQTFNHTGYRVI